MSASSSPCRRSRPRANRRCRLRRSATCSTPCSTRRSSRFRPVRGRHFRVHSSSRTSRVLTGCTCGGRRAAGCVRALALCGPFWSPSTTCSGSIRRRPVLSRTPDADCVTSRSGCCSLGVRGFRAGSLDELRRSLGERATALDVGPLDRGRPASPHRDRLGATLPRPLLAEVQQASGGNPVLCARDRQDPARHGVWVERTTATRPELAPRPRRCAPDGPSPREP